MKLWILLIYLLVAVPCCLNDALYTWIMCSMLGALGVVIVVLARYMMLDKVNDVNDIP